MFYSVVKLSRVSGERLPNLLDPGLYKTVRLLYIYFINLKTKADMKKVFLIRFGMPTQTLGDKQAMDQIGARETSVGAGSPFGIIAIIGTDKSPAEIVQIYKEVAAELQDELPVIAWLEGDQAAADMSAGFFEHFAPMNEAWENEFGRAKKECTMSLDELLDMVKAKGLQNFTTEELQRLKELSK